jgi:hypothetical protein
VILVVLDVGIHKVAKIALRNKLCASTVTTVIRNASNVSLIPLN